MRELNILHEAGDYWVSNEGTKKDPSFHVWKNGVTHATSDSAYHDLTLAITRTNYLNKANKMENFKIKIAQDHTSKTRLENMGASLKKTLERMIPPPSFSYLVDIVRQVLIHEGLDEEFNVSSNSVAGIIYLIDKQPEKIVAGIINYKAPKK